MIAYFILFVITVLPGLLGFANITVNYYMNSSKTINQKCFPSLVHDISIESFGYMIPSSKGKYKGQAGKICVIGGSTEYTGAPYFTAMASLKVGADLAFVVTTESAASVIKAYSPDLIVYPFLCKKNLENIKLLIKVMDVIVIGPGLGREYVIMPLVYEVIHFCRDLRKPLIIDGDGLFAISLNHSTIKDYPSPGVILTPNVREAKGLMQSIPLGNASDWPRFWGKHVSVLNKGKEDTFYSYDSKFQWTISKGGSGRRVGGQGDILSGFLATFYNWVLKSNFCLNTESVQMAHSIAAYAAAHLTRSCNHVSYLKLGRSFTASNMLVYIHKAFKNATSRWWDKIV